MSSTLPRGKAAPQLVGFCRRSPEENFFTSLNLVAAENQHQHLCPLSEGRELENNTKSFMAIPPGQGKVSRQLGRGVSVQRQDWDPPRQVEPATGEVFDATVSANILASGHLQPGRDRCSRPPSRRLTRLGSHETQDFRCIWVNMIW